MDTETAPTTLSQIALGQSAKIVRVGGERLVRRRLLDMGLLVGETVTVTRLAPMGDPIEILVKSYRLSLRKHEANQILVEVQA